MARLCIIRSFFAEQSIIKLKGNRERCDILKKWIDRCFVIFVFFALGAGLGHALLFTKDINTYENRTANKIPAFTLQAYLDETFQTSLEDGLMDQIPFAEQGKRFYNNHSSSMLGKFIYRNMDGFENRYIAFKSMYLFNEEYLTYRTVILDEAKEKLDQKLHSLNTTIAAHPELDIFMFYLEKERDVNLETGVQSNLYEYLAERLDLPENHMDHLSVDNFDEYSERFYKSDHHWNHRGSYQGYRQIAQMLDVPQEEQLLPVEEVNLGYKMIGSKASTVGTEMIYDDFYAFRFLLPEMTVMLNRIPAQDYDNAKIFWNGEGSKISYGAFYGLDFGEVIFDTGNTEKDNILIVGSSYDNAILKLIASHFNQTFSIDLRHYENAMGTAFDFADYITANKIDKVLLVGDYAFYSTKTFDLEG